MSPQFEYIVHGDAEAAVVDILQNATEIQAFSIIKITTDMIGYSRNDRWIMVSRAGGSYRFPKPDHPRIDVEAYAETRAVAHDIMQVVQGVMFREQNNYTGKGLHYISCSVESGMFRSYEKDTDEPRYVISFRLMVSPG